MRIAPARATSRARYASVIPRQPETDLVRVTEPGFLWPDRQQQQVFPETVHADDDNQPRPRRH
ncbi:MAG TPA: hypothetical protein VMV07_23345 [Streptosporangiaceae bacterium]|nr:hypothetical protein [Streptosporangiaceae bacterium]